MIQFPDQFNRILNCCHTRIRTIILCLILLHSPCKHHTRIFLIHGHFDKRIAFIVLEHRIVFWSVLLNQVALQHECLQLRVCHNILKAGDMCHHLFNLGTLVSAALKILPHTIFQADCLTHINDRIFFIVHNINARLGGKFLQFLLNIKHPLAPYVPAVPVLQHLSEAAQSHPEFPLSLLHL